MLADRRPLVSGRVAGGEIFRGLRPWKNFSRKIFHGKFLRFSRKIFCEAVKRRAFWWLRKIALFAKIGQFWRSKIDQFLTARARIRVAGRGKSQSGVLFFLTRQPPKPVLTKSKLVIYEFWLRQISKTSNFGNSKIWLDQISKNQNFEKSKFWKVKILTFKVKILTLSSLISGQRPRLLGADTAHETGTSFSHETGPAHENFWLEKSHELSPAHEI